MGRVPSEPERWNSRAPLDPRSGGGLRAPAHFHAARVAEINQLRRTAVSQRGSAWAQGVDAARTPFMSGNSVGFVAGVPFR